MNDLYVELIPYLLGGLAGAALAALIDAWCRIARMRRTQEAWARHELNRQAPAVVSWPVPSAPYSQNYYPLSPPVWTAPGSQVYHP